MFFGIPHNKFDKYQLTTAQLLNINFVMSKDLGVDEYLHCTGIICD